MLHGAFVVTLWTCYGTLYIVVLLLLVLKFKAKTRNLEAKATTFKAKPSVFKAKAKNGLEAKP